MTKDLIGGLLMLAFSVAYYLQSLNIRRSTMADEVGAHGVPQVFAVMLGVLSLILVAQALFARFRGADLLVMTVEERALLKRSVLRMLGMLAIGVGYLIVVPYLGYALSIGLLLAATTVYQGVSLTWRVVASSVGGAVVLWVIFVVLLDIPLPAGILAKLV